jgi:hypothetical protein
MMPSPRVTLAISTGVLASVICPLAATREHLVSMTDYGANLIWELIYFTLPTLEGTEVDFWAFRRPREFQNNVRF